MIENTNLKQKLLKIKEDVLALTFTDDVAPIKFRCGIVTDIEEIVIDQRSVAILINAYRDTGVKQEIDIEYWFTMPKQTYVDGTDDTNKVLSEFGLNFYDKVSEFLNLLSANEEAYYFFETDRKVDYGSFEKEKGKYSLRSAKVNITYDITKLQYKETITDLMENLNLLLSYNQQ